MSRSVLYIAQINNALQKLEVLRFKAFVTIQKPGAPYRIIFALCVDEEAAEKYIAQLPSRLMAKVEKPRNRNDWEYVVMATHHIEDGRLVEVRPGVWIYKQDLKYLEEGLQ